MVNAKPVIVKIIRELLPSATYLLVLKAITLLFVVSASAAPKKNVSTDCAELLRGADKLPALSAVDPDTKKNDPGFIAPTNTQSSEALSFLDTRTAWEVSRIGLQRMTQHLHRMENNLYYLGAGVLAKEHVLSDGAGGGGKTFSATILLRAQVSAMVENIKKIKIKNKADADYYKKFSLSIDQFMKDLKILVETDKAADPSKKIFTLQLHEMMSEVPILGGVNPFIMVEEGKKVIDYSTALIAEKNFFALLDEIEKAPVAVQMTLLSILNEREAFSGNEIIQTMLESVVATTNASLGELIAQAKPYEIGGRQAMIDRFALKANFTNVGASAKDNYEFIRKARQAKDLNGSTLIDLRSLRPMLKQILIPQEMITAASEIVLLMDEKYTLKYNTELAQSGGKTPRYYPPFSGSGRASSKVIKLWKSAFLMRQLLSGIPFESVNLQMTAKDLVDLAPALLQGGSDQIIAGDILEVPFVYTDGIAPISNVSNSANNNSTKKGWMPGLSEGYYDPYAQIFSFRDPISGQQKRTYFDIRKKQLVALSQELRERLRPNPDDQVSSLEEQIFKIHQEFVVQQIAAGQQKQSNYLYKLTGYFSDLLSGAPLRAEGRAQISEMAEFHTDLIAFINDKINFLNGQSLHNYKSKPTFFDEEETYKKLADELRKQMTTALTAQDQKQIVRVGITAIRQFYEEAGKKILNSDSSIQSLLEVTNFGGNLQLFGPPGSAKTMLSRMVLSAALEFINEADIYVMNAELAKALHLSGVKDKKLYVKQFHPQSNESDILGHIDLAKLREDKKYSYNRDSSLSAQNIFYALLDEFEKSPPGVRTACLSVLNEREVMAGDERISLLINAIILSTNSTPGEFIVSQGRFSTAFPIHDRIHKRSYAFNKLKLEDMRKLLERAYFDYNPVVHAPLPIGVLQGLAAKVVVPDEYLREILMPVDHTFLTKAVERSEAERSFHDTDPQKYPDFYINSRGESWRSKMSVVDKEIKNDLILQRVLDGVSADDLIEAKKIRFDLRDLTIFANQYLTRNFAYKIGTEYVSGGFIRFTVVENDISWLDGHINSRERKMLENMRWEADTFVTILNTQISEYLNKNLNLVVRHPNLFPNAFVSPSEREAWLTAQGVSKDLIQQANGK